jgi:hypothetical protein
MALLLTAAACADTVDSPDAGFGPDAARPDTMTGPQDSGLHPDAQARPDAEVPFDAGVVEPGLRLKALHLTPAAGNSSSPQHNLRGGLRSTSTLPATSPAHRLRGGVVPGGTQAVTP